MKLPSQSRIDGATWQVASIPRYREESGDYGRTTNHDLTMRIDTSVAPAVIRDVLLHEHLHAMSMVRLSVEDQLTERQVAGLSGCLLQWLRTNHNLLDFLMEKE